MSRASSVIVRPCGLDDMTEAPGELPLTMRQAQDARSKDATSKVVHASLESMQNTAVERVSKSPTGSSRSKSSGALPLGIENVPPSRNISYTMLPSNIRREAFVIDSPAEAPTHDPVLKNKKPLDLPYKDEVENVQHYLDTLQIRHPGVPRSGELSVVNLDPEDFERHTASNGESHFSDDSSEEETSVGAPPYSNRSPSQNSSPHIVITSTPPKTLKRFVGSIRRRRFNGPRHLVCSEERQDLGNEFEPRLKNSEHLEIPPPHEYGRHRKTSSGFSSTFLTSHKSPVTDPSSSSGNISSQKNQRSHLSRFSKRSSRLSSNTKRSSLDSDDECKTTSLKSSVHRALQRRRIIAELIDSESGYLVDLRILTYVRIEMNGYLATSLHKSRFTLLFLVVRLCLTKTS